MQSGADKMKAELDRPISPSAADDSLFQRHRRPARGCLLRSSSGLLQQIVSPVKWEQTMKLLIAEGGEGARFVELAPNRHLAGLAKRINRRIADRKPCDRCQMQKSEVQNGRMKTG